MKHKKTSHKKIYHRKVAFLVQIFLCQLFAIFSISPNIIDIVPSGVFSIEAALYVIDPVAIIISGVVGG